ncbi:Uncharacterized protein Rs2_41379 [Raphanus sativus]|nr:Uncharacterized protein Rs2_41379 [Raphanus sativus]
MKMSTEELLRTSRSQRCLLNASVSNSLTKPSQNCSFFGFLVQWKWYSPEQSYQAFSVLFLKLWTWQKKRQVLCIKMAADAVLVVSHHHRRLRSFYGTQQKIQIDGFISLTKSPFCRFLVMCLYDNLLQILSSSGHLLLRHEVVFQPLASPKALPHYLIMEIRNNKRLEVEVTLHMKKVHGYNIVISSIFIHWKEVPPDQVPMSVGMALFESTTSIFCELHAVKVHLLGQRCSEGGSILTG